MQTLYQTFHTRLFWCLGILKIIPLEIIGICFFAVNEFSVSFEEIFSGKMILLKPNIIMTYYI